MGAPVRIEARAWNDIRFRTLARLLGMADPDHALIKVARLWSWQTENYTPENPTYAIDRDTIESILGEGGPEALVRAKLASETPGGWRMHGTEGQIEWCSDVTEKRQRGGKARAAAARRDDKGRMTGNGGDSHPAHAGHAGPAPSSKHPGQSSSPTPTPSPIPEEELSPARAIPPTAVPSTTDVQIPPGESSWHRRMRWWVALLEADARVRRAGIEPNAPTFPPAPAGANEQNMNAVEHQLLEAGLSPEDVDAKMLHIVAVAEAEATRERSRRFFKPAVIWKPDNANRAVDTSLEEARAGPARGAKQPTSNGRAIGRAEPKRPEDYREGDQKL